MQMNIQSIRNWIFDMDGTLTVNVHDFDAMREQLGIGDTPILEGIAMLPPDEAEKAHRRLTEIEMELADLGRSQPDCKEFLSKLLSNGCNIAVLTRNADEIAHRTLKAAGLSELFEHDAIIGRDGCKPKPDPEGIQFHLDRWNVKPVESAMMGDFVFDLKAGRNANVTTVHFDETAEFQWPELADIKVTSWKQLDGIIFG